MWNFMGATLFLQLVALVLVIFPYFSEQKPVVDPGLFMILGVESCRNGSGYCLLGLDCTLDDDFLPDDSGGHCKGLEKAFTPSAHFTCCKENPNPPLRSAPKRKKPIPPEITTKKPITPSNTTIATDSQTFETVSTTLSELPTTLEVNNSTVATDILKFETMPTTSDDQQTTDFSTTDVISISNTEQNIYIDVSNQVFKEVTAPVLTETTISP